MSCEECLAAIDEYVEGELPEAAAARVSAHVAACAPCRGRYEGLLREQRVYTQYLLDVEATPALWAGLRSGIEEVKAASVSGPWGRLREWFAAPFPAPRLSPAVAAALALITIGVAVGVLRHTNSREAERRDDISQQGKSADIPSPSQGTVISSDEVPDNSEGGDRPLDKDRIASARSNTKRDNLTSGATARGIKSRDLKLEASRGESVTAQVVRTTERQYQAAIALLSRDFSRRRARLNPIAAGQLERALAELDRTIEETRRAAREHPDDPVMVQYMMTAYAKKVDALRQLAGT